MDIRNSLDGLKSILGVSQATPSAPQTRSNPSAGGSALVSDRATFSHASSAVSQSASADSGVRTDKVAAIQAQLAAGTYSVSPTAIASKMVDSMLSSGSN